MCPWVRSWRTDIAMKKNMVPLLGIAFVVAIISTGVFYGLFAGRLKSSETGASAHGVLVAAHDLEPGVVLGSEDVRTVKIPGALAGSFSNPNQVVGSTLLAAVKQNEPLLDSRLASKDGKEGGTSGPVPAGMRALSVHVSQSEGLAVLLHAGSKVDLQSVVEKNGTVGLHTILENVEVLAVNPQPQAPVFAMTVLVPANVAEMVALADAGSHVRVALRNPLDGESVAGHGAPRSSEKTAAGRKQAGPGANVHVQVRVLGVSTAALAELKSAAKSGGSNLQVAKLGTEAEAKELVERLASKHEIELVSDKAFTVSAGEPGSFRANSGGCRLRVHVAPEAAANGEVKLRIEPEVSRASSAGVETTRYDAKLSSDGSFLIEGLLSGSGDRTALEKMFPGHAWAERSLVIVVSAQPDRGAVSALPKSNRGQ